MTPVSLNSLPTSPMRRMFSVRSSLLGLTLVHFSAQPEPLFDTKYTRNAP